jgi:glycosyltransferase involved in cell wall biosynthesis
MQHALILKRYGFSPILCFMKNASVAKEVLEFAENHEMPVEFLEYTRYVFAKKTTWSDLKYVPALKNWMMAWKIRFVHCVTYMPAVSLAAYELSIPALATLHKYYEAPHNTASISHGEERFVSAIHSSSFQYADVWQNVMGAPAYCIRAPIADSYFEEYSKRSNRDVSDAPTLLVSGTIQPRKGQLNAIKAVANLKEKGIIVNLVLLGYDDLLPEYVSECRKFIKEFNLEEQVSMPGFSPSPKAYYDNADFLLCSSDEESMPQSILKGMASGMRIITTPVGGVKELVVDGFSGIVSHGYEAENLEEAILRALRTSKKQWQVMLKNAHLAAQMSCSQEVVTNKLLVLYNLAVEENVRLVPRPIQPQDRQMLSHAKQRLVGKLRDNRFMKKHLLKLAGRFRQISLHTELNPDFQQFLDDSYTFQDVKGFALQPSLDLQNVEYMSYKIEFNRSGLSEVSIAPILERPLRQGIIGIEIISPANQITRQATISVLHLRKDTPAKFVFKPLSETQQGAWELRIFARDVEGTIRLFEWRKYSWWGLGRLRTRMFAAFKFA